MFRVTNYPMISKTESGLVSKEIPGSGSGSGTRWALFLLEIWVVFISKFLDIASHFINIEDGKTNRI